METDEMIRQCYLIAEENHCVNVQILKNQKVMLKFLKENIAKGRVIYDLEKQVEETDNILRQITSEKE